MEMKYVVPDMAQSFGTLEFAGESDHVFDRDKDNRRFFARRSYNLYSDVQKGENVVVEIPVQACFSFRVLPSAAQSPGLETDCADAGSLL